MYKVMLVDDENIILDGLRVLIDWTSLNLAVTTLAYDGSEALQSFKNDPVDIVITDITMPEMDGLKLIKKIKEISKNTKFVILSGYDDFNYAKQAIRLGIENYILKPINEFELYSTLKTICEKLQKEQLDSIEFSKMDEILRNNILYRWLTNNISLLELKEREAVLSFNLEYEYYCVSLLKFDFKGKAEASHSYVKEFLLREMRLKDNVYLLNDLDENIVIIWGSNEGETVVNEIRKFLDKLLNRIIEDLGVKVFITQGSLEKGNINVHKSYSMAKKLQNYLLIKGYNTIVNCYYGDESGNLKKLNLDINSHDFEKVILTTDIEKIRKYIDNIFQSFMSVNFASPDLVHNIAIRILMEINKIHEEFNVSYEGSNNLREMIIQTCKVCTVEELKEEIMNECVKLGQSIRSTSSEMSPIIKQILAYIKEHYNDELSLKSLGYKFKINPSYLGQIFHKEIGESFSDYINNIKNEKAKELLLTSNLRVSEIAKIVGYTDNNYFYRKFKECFGVSPNSLRGNKNY